MSKKYYWIAISLTITYKSDRNNTTNIKSNQQIKPCMQLVLIPTEHTKYKKMVRDSNTSWNGRMGG